jgi:hypothetical protein
VMNSLVRYFDLLYLKSTFKRNASSGYIYSLFSFYHFIFYNIYIIFFFLDYDCFFFFPFFFIYIYIFFIHPVIILSIKLLKYFGLSDQRILSNWRTLCSRTRMASLWSLLVNEEVENQLSLMYGCCNFL